MSTASRALALQQVNRRGVFCITGGGSLLVPELLTTPGASKTVLEVSVPYAGPALTSYLGQAPEQSCSETTARAMAVAAFERARRLTYAGDAGAKRAADRCFGLACTASLATDRTKRGDHRAFLAVQTATHSFSARYDFSRATSRRTQEKQLTEAQWLLLERALALDIDDDLKPPSKLKATATTATQAQRGWRQLLSGDADAVPAAGFPRGQTPPPPKLLLPGSFNPLHAGHRRMLEVAEQQLGVAGAFELAIANVDKPSLDYSTIAERLAPFRGRRSAGALWLTRLPTFLGKARAFPGVTFAVGADTAERIGMPKYYGGQAACNAALDELAALDVRFLVFGRAAEGGFQTLKQLKLPKRLHRLCVGVAEATFRMDLSSSELRRKQRSARH